MYSIPTFGNEAARYFTDLADAEKALTERALTVLEMHNGPARFGDTAELYIAENGDFANRLLYKLVGTNLARVITTEPHPDVTTEVITDVATGEFLGARMWTPNRTGARRYKTVTGLNRALAQAAKQAA